MVSITFELGTYDKTKPSGSRLSGNIIIDGKRCTIINGELSGDCKQRTLTCEPTSQEPNKRLREQRLPDLGEYEFTEEEDQNLGQNLTQTPDLRSTQDQELSPDNLKQLQSLFSKIGTITQIPIKQNQ